MSVLSNLTGMLPKATPVASIPSVVSLIVSEVEGQTRRKFVGTLDAAKSVQVNIYLPEGVAFPSEIRLDIPQPARDEDGEVIVVDGVTQMTEAELFNLGQCEPRTKKGSVKLAWGDLRDSDLFGAAVFMPPKASITTVVCTTE